VWEDHIEYCIGCEICEIAVAVVEDESGKLGASLSCQVLQPGHCELDRAQVLILHSAVANINIHKSRSVYFWFGDTGDGSRGFETPGHFGRVVAILLRVTRSTV
jgi:hypothetical protein